MRDIFRRVREDTGSTFPRFCSLERPCAPANAHAHNEQKKRDTNIAVLFENLPHSLRGLLLSLEEILKILHARKKKAGGQTKRPGGN